MAPLTTSKRRASTSSIGTAPRTTSDPNFGQEGGSDAALFVCAVRRCRLSLRRTIVARHTFFCIDAHTCGNPVRVVAGGAPLLPNVPMIEKREIFIREHDWVRRALMFEPRGHDVM